MSAINVNHVAIDRGMKSELLSILRSPRCIAMPGNLFEVPDDLFDYLGAKGFPLCDIDGLPGIRVGRFRIRRERPYDEFLSEIWKEKIDAEEVSL